MTSSSLCISHQLMNQLAIKSLERENISEAFSQHIQSMTIYSVSIFVKTDSMMKFSFDEYRMSCCLIATSFQQLEV